MPADQHQQLSGHNAQHRASGGDKAGINHLASRNAQWVPNSSLTGNYRLKVVVDGPDSKASPVAMVLVQKKDGSVVRSQIALNSKGKGTKTVGFNFTNTASVTLTMGNASTRFNCWTSGPTYSCYGQPKDDSKPFTFKGRVLPPA